MDDGATSDLGPSGEPDANPPGSNPYHGVCKEGSCYWYVKNEVNKTAIGMEYATNVSKPVVSSFDHWQAHSIDQLAAGAVEEKDTFRYTIETGFDVDPGLFEPEQIEKEEVEVAKHEKEQVKPPGQPHFFIFVNPDRYGTESCYIDNKREDNGCENFVPSAGAKITPNEIFEPSTAKLTLGVKYLPTCFKGATGGCWWIWAGTQWIGYVPESFWEGNFTHATSENDYGEVLDSESLPTSQMGDGQYGASAGATSMTQILAILNENEEETTGYHTTQTNGALYSPGDVNSGKTEWHFGGPGADPVPIVTTEGSGVNPPSSVEVKGSADPNNLETHYYFEYGPTTSYGSVSPTEAAGSGVEPVSVNATLTGLKPGTTYHYRLVAYNADGYGYGADSTFNVPWWFIQATQNPHGSFETDKFRGVSCWSVTGCDAVGNNTNAEDEIVGLAERWNGMSWEVQSTPKSTGAIEDDLEGVSCRSASECEATGYAELAENKHVTLAERWNGTAWSVQSTPANKGEDSNLVSVSCASASECVASGFSLPKTGMSAALVELWNGKEWKVQTTAKLPTEDEESWFEHVSCPSAKHCIAVGAVNAGLEGTLPLIESYNGSKWTLQSAPHPEGSIGALLRGVSCSATSECTAVGEYDDAPESGERPLVERYTGTSWQLQEAASPVGKPAPKESHWALKAVSCPTSGSCVAVGSYAESAGGQDRLLGEEWNGSRWELAPPVDRAGVLEDEAGDVSCSAALTCTLAGLTWKEKGTYNTETLAERIWEQ